MPLDYRSFGQCCHVSKLSVKAATSHLEKLSTLKLLSGLILDIPKVMYNWCDTHGKQDLQSGLV